jgi:uncharacterized protein YjbJ (UPF0337 family)
MSDTASGVGGASRLDRLKGKVKEVAGSAVGNRELREEGKLNQERVDAAEEAQREAAQAERRQAEADLAVKEAELAAEREQLAAEQAAQSDRHRLERDREQTEHQIDRQYEVRAAAENRRERSAHTATVHDEAAAIRDRGQADVTAHHLEQAADEARQAAADLENAQHDQSEA